jgi:hypothetical protein
MSTNFEDLIMRDTRANQPAAGVPGRLYYVTDENELERDNGAAWESIEGIGDAGDVVGPGSAVDGNMAAFDGVTGKLLKDGGVVSSSTYTPSLTNATNVAASTAYQCQWLRIGNVVTVSGKVSIDPTATGAIILGVSLPVASNIGNDYELGGVFANSIGEKAGRISGDATNNRANFVALIAVDTTNQPWWFTFTYLVI